MAKRGRGAWVRRTVSASLGVYDAREVSLCPRASLSAALKLAALTWKRLLSLSPPPLALSLSLGHG